MEAILNETRKRGSERISGIAKMARMDGKSGYHAGEKNEAHKDRKGEEGTSVDTARRVITYRTGYHALEFHIHDWTEISSSKLYAIYPQHTLTGIFDSQMKQRMSNFAGAANGFFRFCRINVTPVRISNSIVLSDQIQVSTTGVTEVSSFVQSCKLLHFRLNSHRAFILSANQSNLYMSPLTIPAFPQRQSIIVPMQTADNTAYTIRDVEFNPCYAFPAEAYADVTGTNFAGLKDNGWYYTAGSNNSINQKIPMQFGFLRKASATTGYLDNNIGFQDWTRLKQPANKIKDFKLMDHPHNYIDAGECVELPVEGFNHAYAQSPQSISSLYFNTTTVQYTASTASGSDTIVSIRTGVTPHSYPSEALKFGDFDFARTMIRAAHKQKEPPLPADFLTMIPIMTSSGSYMNIRANLKYEFKVTFEFSNSEFEPNATDPVEAVTMLDENIYLAPVMREIEQAAGMMQVFIR